MKLIDKDKIVAEIEKRKSELQSKIVELGTFESNTLGLFQDVDLYDDILSFIDTLETKEINLEEEISNYLTSYHLHIKDGGRVVFDNNDSPNFMCDIRHIAKHFYELGLNTK